MITKNFCFLVDFIRPTGPMVSMVTRYTGGLSQFLMVEMSWKKIKRKNLGLWNFFCFLIDFIRLTSPMVTLVTKYTRDLSSSWPWPRPTWSLTWLSWSLTWPNLALAHLVTKLTKPSLDLAKSGPGLDTIFWKPTTTFLDTSTGYNQSGKKYPRKNLWLWTTFVF